MPLHTGGRTVEFGHSYDSASDNHDHDYYDHDDYDSATGHHDDYDSASCYYNNHDDAASNFSTSRRRRSRHRFPVSLCFGYHGHGFLENR